MLTKLLFSLLFYSLIQINCQDMNITIWDNRNQDLSSGSLSIRIFQNTDIGLLSSIIEALKGQKLLPMCSMVGCASNATQCVAHGGQEMVNKISVDQYTQAYFKSVLTLDKTYLSINCNKLLVPCCFPKTTNNRQPKPSNSPPFSMPSSPTFIRELTSLVPELPPISVFVLSNICMGLGGGIKHVSCNQEE